MSSITCKNFSLLHQIIWEETVENLTILLVDALMLYFFHFLGKQEWMISKPWMNVHTCTLIFHWVLLDHGWSLTSFINAFRGKKWGVPCTTSFMYSSSFIVHFFLSFFYLWKQIYLSYPTWKNLALFSSVGIFPMHPLLYKYFM